ncbi:MAG TPA: glycosyltransferase [Candidatus Sulfotelmatobacter sp.]|nr:glycosyltransferase [Candidatus Sulfotelmatobacter sp.]
MKVLHVTPSFHPAYLYGGPILSTLELCRNLAELGSEIRVLTTDANGPRQVLDVETNAEVQSPDGFRVRYCARRWPDSVSPTLLRLLPAYVRWADVVHLTAVYNFPTFPTLLWARVLNKPIIWSPRGALQRWEGSLRVGRKQLWDFLWYHVANRDDLIMHVTSEEEGRDTVARFPKVRTAMIPNGVDVPVDLKRVKQNGELRLLFIGRLDPKKGIEALLKACSLIGTDLPWRLQIAGWGAAEYLSQLEGQVRALGIDDQVKFAGEVLAGAKKRLFESSDVTLVPSYTENFAIVVAEALAHGIPVIASKGTPWSRLEEMKCGLWVDNDPQTLAEAILRISRMPLHEMGWIGREWMQREFSWRSVSQQMLHLYKETASAR